MDVENFFVANNNLLYFALGYFLADLLHYIFVVPYVLRLQQKVKEFESCRNHE